MRIKTYKQTAKCISLVEETCEKLIEIANEIDPSSLPYLVLDFVANLIDCINAAYLYAELLAARDANLIDAKNIIETVRRVNIRPAFKEQLLTKLKERLLDNRDVA